MRLRLLPPPGRLAEGLHRGDQGQVRRQADRATAVVRRGGEGRGARSGRAGSLRKGAAEALAGPSSAPALQKESGIWVRRGSRIGADFWGEFSRGLSGFWGRILHLLIFDIILMLCDFC